MILHVDRFKMVDFRHVLLLIESNFVFLNKKWCYLIRSIFSTEFRKFRNWHLQYLDTANNFGSLFSKGNKSLNGEIFQYLDGLKCVIHWFYKFIYIAQSDWAIPVGIICFLIRHKNLNLKCVVTVYNKSERRYSRNMTGPSKS